MKYIKLFESFEVKSILFLVEDGFNYSEFQEPYKALNMMGHDCETSSPKSQSEQITSSVEGVKIINEIPTEKVNPKDYDLLLIPGGSSPSKLKKIEEVLQLVREFDKLHRPIAAICHGPEVLAESGILKNGVNITGNKEISDLLNQSGGNYKDERVIVDGNLITSRKPEDLPFFIQEISKILD